MNIETFFRSRINKIFDRLKRFFTESDFREEKAK